MIANVAVCESYYNSASDENSEATKAGTFQVQPQAASSGRSVAYARSPAFDELRLCSNLHEIVHEFRKAHGITPAAPSQRREVISQYTVNRAPSEQAEEIMELTKPEVYAKLRHGGRLLSSYPPLSEGEVRELCEEIRAALVWQVTRASG